MVRLTDRPTMTIAVDLGRKATLQTNNTLKLKKRSVLCDMMHVHFATRKVARPKMPISKGR